MPSRNKAGCQSSSGPNRKARIMTNEIIRDHEDRIDELEVALYNIAQWSEAYPLDIFPEPDLIKARALLEAGGITLDAISAHCMRHVIKGVGKIASEALGEEDGTEGPENR